ncbi:hypothetical protein V8E54_002356 [Elaphomyces granulatus]
MAGTKEGMIYSATYSGVPVFEFQLHGDCVMRRRSDDWINATHILKAAGFDKSARTRILERQVQKGVHEKVQGGYGKYQGTWIPLPDGRLLAERNNIFDKLGSIFDFVPGDRSPPPAPKHVVAASRPKASKAASNAITARKRLRDDKANRMGPPSFSRNQHEMVALEDDESVEQTTLESSSMVAEEDMVPASANSRKRKRGMNDITGMSISEQEHILYGDQLLDYFMTVGDAPEATRIPPPEPPTNFQVDRPIDDSGSTALHWACAMGDLEIVRDLLRRGANVQALSKHDETPLVRAVLFTNNYEKRTMPELVSFLQENLTFRDWFGATVFHHIAVTARSKGKWKSTRYYCEVLIQRFRDTRSQSELEKHLSRQDKNGDTAALVAARNGAFRLVDLLLLHGPDAGDLVNKNGQTATELIARAHHRERIIPHPPSSVTQGNDQDPEIAVHSGSDNPYTLSQNSSTAASALLTKIGDIMEEANKRLIQAYGSARLSQEGHDLMTNPETFLEQLEADRQKLQKQTLALSSRERENEPLDIQSKRYEQVKRRYESLLEQTQRSHLLERFGITTPVPDASKRSTPPSSQELTHLYRLARELSLLQKSRQTAISDLVQQKADAGVSDKFDVHRKLVALATGLKEEELDPMSAELAETLEFDRIREALDLDSPEPDTPRQLPSKEVISTSLSSTVASVGVKS